MALSPFSAFICQSQRIINSMAQPAWKLPVPSRRFSLETLNMLHGETFVILDKLAPLKLAKATKTFCFLPGKGAK